MVENQIIYVFMLDRATWESYYRFVELSYIRANYPLVYKLFLSLNSYYEKYSQVDTCSRVSLESQYLVLYPMLKETDRKEVGFVLDNIESSEVETATIVALLETHRQRSVTSQIALTALDVSENRKPVEDLIRLTELLNKPLDLEAGDEFETLSTDIEELAASEKLEPGLKWRLTGLNKSLGPLRKGNMGHIFARIECVAGDEIVRIKANSQATSAKNLTMSEFFNRFNGLTYKRIRKEKRGDFQIQATTPEGNVYYTGIEHVTFSGKKEVFKVTTKRGFSVKASANHEFLLEDGTYKKLHLLEVGDKLRTDRTENQKRLSRKERGGIWEGCPYEQKMVGKWGPYHRVKTHRLAYDAGLNGLSVEKFVSELAQGKAAQYQFSDQTLDIHHKNMNHLDDSFENLVLLTRTEHTRLHLLARNVGCSRHADADEIVSIEPAGEADCYDIGVIGENQNFRVSGVYVHNCGKTACWISESTYMVPQLKDDQQLVIFFNEEDGKAIMWRMYSAVLHMEYPQILANPKEAKRRFYEAIGGEDKILFFDRPTLSKKFIERALDQCNPGLIVIDNMDKVVGFEADRKDLQLANCYKWGRELAKTYAPVLTVAQADMTADNKMWISESQMADGKTGKPSETDFTIGIGRTDTSQHPNERFIYISRNKLRGDSNTLEGLRHAKFTALLEPTFSIYSDGGTHAIR